jgi:hypothetical protein
MRVPALTLLFLPLFPVLLSPSVGCRAEPDENLPAAPPRVAPAKKQAPPPPACNANDDPLLSEPFTDSFDRTDLGADWNSTSYGAYFIRSNRLCIAKPRNHPLWLKRRLPANVKVEFDATPSSANADVKVELFGDGCSFDTEGRDYTATAYVAVLGAHSNSEHWLARMFEHGPEAKKTPLVTGGPSVAASKLIANTTYHVELARTDAKTVSFKVDGVLVHDMIDAQPLAGPGHDHFAFNGWDAPSCFDKLVITPLP